MASREHQGLQIALIICAVLVIGLGVATYAFYSSSTSETARANNNLKEAQTSKEALTKAVDEMTQLKQLMGYGAAIDLGSILANYKKDLETYAASMPESERNYRNVVSQLATELQKKNDLLVEAENRSQQLQGEFKNKEKSNATEIAQYQDGLKKAKDDLSGEIDKFGKDRDGFKKRTAELAHKLEGKQKDFDEETSKKSKELDETATVLTKTRQTLDAMIDRSKGQELSAEMSDGKVTWVSQRDRIVYLNLGSDDGLRRQISFSVVGADEMKLLMPEREAEESKTRQGNIKGSVEVISLLGRHLAEARIMDDDPSDPIMPGDQLFSAAWRPGHPEHFALVGLMDLDKNGISDLAKVENLITVNGGVIDAALKDDGARSGSMSVDTRYLVMGKKPTEKEESKYIDGYSAMMKEAEGLPVQRITLEDLILYLGYKDHERTVPLGSDAKSKDFPARAPNDVPRRSHNESFNKPHKLPARDVDKTY